MGEAPLSFGFDSNGKKCTDSKFEDYGKRYSLFDVIGVYLVSDVKFLTPWKIFKNCIQQDLESTPCTIEYTINGESQGKAFEFEKESLEGKALYPQISTKNIGYAVNFGQTLPTLYSSVPPKPKVTTISYNILILFYYKKKKKLFRITDVTEIPTDVQMTTIKANLTKM